MHYVMTCRYPTAKMSTIDVFANDHSSKSKHKTILVTNVKLSFKKACLKNMPDEPLKSYTIRKIYFVNNNLCSTVGENNQNLAGRNL